MNLDQVVEGLQQDPDFLRNVTAWKVLPARPAEHGDWPAQLDPRLTGALRERGISRPYTHQQEAIEAALAGKNVTVVTSTASGKTLCYNTPVLQTILGDPSRRALYLFPTKALSQDQYAELHGLIELTGADIKTYTYDGDTPVSARRAIRVAGHVVVTNPDMLHGGILPHHTKWQRLFENLSYVVVDELHHYRGVFGSHVANVLRRLARVCEFYGSKPQFISCSATIANPLELAHRLTGRESVLVDKDGSARGARHFVFYNPPAINQQLGLRQSAAGSTARLARHFLANDVQTIVFARSRVMTEVLLTRIRQGGRNANSGAAPITEETVRGYRGGYLPLQRREIEHGLRDGSIRGVVATNALELGVDIGQLEAAVLCGYPGTIASTWQQSGRAGRRSTTSIAVMVADSSPLDQFVVTHPEYFFERQPESALVNPDNLFVLMSHLPCAAFELPFEEGERYGDQDQAATQQALQSLGDAGELLAQQGTWHWSGRDYPADSVSLRTAQRENLVIIDITTPRPQVLGECDPFAAPTLVHKDAIYLHQGQQYHIVDMDWEQKKAYAKAVSVDYYTDSSFSFNVSVLVDEARQPVGPMEKTWGEVRLTYKPDIFKKIRIETHENVGWGTIDLPQQEMQTTAYWLTISDELMQRLGSAALQSSLLGLEHVLGNVAPLFLMCAPHDLISVSQVKSPFTNQPTIFLCDAYPGGVGHASKLFQTHLDVMQAARALVGGCACETGCPSCVGPSGEAGRDPKQDTIALLDAALGLLSHEPAGTALVAVR
jgi:DEAD/DEAH box helicase domain-containing protein